MKKIQINRGPEIKGHPIILTIPVILFIVMICLLNSTYGDNEKIEAFSEDITNSAQNAPIHNKQQVQQEEVISTEVAKDLVATNQVIEQLEQTKPIEPPDTKVQLEKIVNHVIAEKPKQAATNSIVFEQREISKFERETLEEKLKGIIIPITEATKDTIITTLNRNISSPTFEALLLLKPNQHWTRFYVYLVTLRPRTNYHGLGPIEMTWFFRSYTKKINMKNIEKQLVQLFKANNNHIEQKKQQYLEQLKYSHH